VVYAIFALYCLALLGLFIAIAVLVDEGMKSLFDIKKVIGNLPDRLELPLTELTLFKYRWFKENCH